MQSVGTLTQIPRFQNVAPAKVVERDPGLRASLWAAFHLVLLVVLLALWCLLQEDLTRLPTVMLCNLATLSVLSLICITLRAVPRGMWSASAVFLLVFALFHFGATAILGLGFRVRPEYEHYTIGWFYTSDGSRALCLAVIGAAAFALGVRMASIGVFNQATTARTLRPSTLPEERIGVAFGTIGFVLVLACTSAWILEMLRHGGPTALASAYGVYRTEVLEGGSAHDTLMLYITFGVVLLAAARPSVARGAGLVIFAIWGALALQLGLRGPVLFPAAAAVVVAARRKIPCSRKTAVVLAVATLSLVTFIKGYRQYGMTGFQLSDVRANPLEAVLEMGNSLRPVAVAIQWREEGDKLIYGASYWAPFDRALGRIVPGWPRLDAEDDERLLNVLIIQRVGPFGFSIIAEAYRNFGQVGVPLVMLLTGLLLGRLDSGPVTHVQQAVLGVVLFALLYIVRNAFIQFPATVFQGFVVLGLAVFVAYVVRGHRRLPMLHPRGFPADA